MLGKVSPILMFREVPYYVLLHALWILELSALWVMRCLVSLEGPSPVGSLASREVGAIELR